MKCEMMGERLLKPLCYVGTCLGSSNEVLSCPSSCGDEVGQGLFGLLPLTGLETAIGVDDCTSVSSCVQPDAQGTGACGREDITLTEVV